MAAPLVIPHTMHVFGVVQVAALKLWMCGGSVGGSVDGAVGSADGSVVGCEDGAPDVSIGTEVEAFVDSEEVFVCVSV